jgi:HSP20 family protein
LDEEDKDYCRREITNGKLERKFKLPDTVDRDNIDANLKNGLLEIKLSKKENTYKRINISTS